MDQIDAEEKMVTSSPSKLVNGGLRTMPFIIANESFEKISSYGLLPNMIFYLITGYKMSSADGQSVLSLWSAASNSMPLLGAFISDSYLGRFRVIALGSIFSFVGVTLLWLTAMIPSAKPPMGESPTPGQLAMLLCAFGLMSIGAGGIRPCSIAFGADQLDRKDNPNNQRVIQSYFSWYYASIGVSTIIALTVIVYIQDQLGWKLGFGIPAILMLVAAVMFFLGSPLYVKVKADKSLFTGLAQVIVVTFKNRSLAYPSDDGHYHCSKDSNLISPSKKLRFLNKACIIRDPQRDLNPDGSVSKPWNLCTIEQVESLKALVRILPIWSTGIIIYMSLTQGTFSTIQASVMDRRIISDFKISAGSFSVFTIITLTIWVTFYDRVMIPLLAKYTGRPRGLSNETRMGIGLVLACCALVVSAIVENIRRRKAIHEGLRDSAHGVVSMSAMWLVPQFCIGGLAEGFNAVGQIEFYYSQLPKNMASLAMALFSLGNAFSGLFGSIFIETVDRVTKRGGKVSWADTNPNKGHYDYCYWLLAILCFVNFLYFLVCCWFYGPSEEEIIRAATEEEVGKDDMSQGN